MLTKEDPFISSIWRGLFKWKAILWMRSWLKFFLQWFMAGRVMQVHQPLTCKRIVYAPLQQPMKSSFLHTSPAAVCELPPSNTYLLIPSPHLLALSLSSISSSVRITCFLTTASLSSLSLSSWACALTAFNDYTTLFSS